MSVRWIIWDWNGTLLDDTSAALKAFNVQLVKRGLKPITLQFYRDNFAFPVRPFYSLCGFELERENWDALAREYHESYAAEAKELNAEARTALQQVKAAGVGQCVLSALRQDLLDCEIAEYGLDEYFDYVYGVDNLDGASKLTRARELIERLAPCPRNEIVIIGDSIHDQEVASELGVRAVLCAQGSHSELRLRAVAPTASTLLEAVSLA